MELTSQETGWTLEQTETRYDGAGDVVLQTTRQRFHNAAVADDPLHHVVGFLTAFPNPIILINQSSRHQ
jgi:hypothetical protein